MRLVFAALLAAALTPSVARAAPRPTVPGTAWALDDGWAASDVAALAEVATHLPATWRDTEARLTLADARPFSDGDTHALAWISRFAPNVTLATRGLAQRLREATGRLHLADAPGGFEAAADFMLRRALVHELAHLLDRLGGDSRTRGWRDLSGWNVWSYMPTPWPRSASGDFAAPWGARSPAEDFATFAEVYFVPPRLGALDAEDAPRCRFPAKYAWLRAHLDPHPDPTPNVDCSGPSDVGLSPGRVGDIDILWASPTLSSLATVGGHLLLAVEILEGETSRWDSFALLADAGGTPAGTAEFAVMGLAGGFPARLLRVPYDATRFRYVEGENRDLLRFRWSLSADEKARLLARLDDISLHWRRPYLFFQQNCSALIVELANAVERRPLRPPAVVPPDLVLAELARRGRITAVAPDPQRDLSPATRARLVAATRGKLARSACGEGLSETTARDAARRDAAYATLARRARDADSDACWRELARVLAFSSPLEQALRARATPGEPEAQTGEGYAAALGAVRDHVPMALRLALRDDVERTVAEAWTDDAPRGGAALHTPYAPLTVGVRTEATASPTPMVFLRREAVRLVRGEPRLFAPAKGADLRMLATEVAVAPWPVPRVALAHDLFSFAYHGEPLLPVPAWGAGAELLSLRVDMGERRAWARWVGFSGGLSLARSRDARRYLDLSVGADVRTAFDATAGELAATTWFVAPVRLRGVLHTNGAAQLGLDGDIAALPALTTTGAPAVALEGTGHAWVYLGHVGTTAVELALGGRAPRQVAGVLDLPPPAAEIGIRLERW